ncbi:energy-coupling factor transporter transmembrane protein EcfT [Nocardioides sp. KC13]|uniref:Energy-coupling factor transporter transmembrane protein EcfT n=1 Tax=Nocardioides turkmenicus TaxID=2711220 RepID=A0A6M1R4B2_9ACTN|nr:CbiQ family ECF transporter T component [Nocardioides sp. KC13]NGN92509.1 energy-coupling factor transporter transmembrane protein EcfT [Nocardioides sp. KC13]
MSMTIGLYRPGDTVLHRLPVGAKLLGLAVLSIAIVVLRGPLLAVGFLGVAVVLALIGRLDLAATARALRVVLVIAVVVALLQWWLFTLPRAVESLLDLVSLALLALTLTVTTPTTETLDAVVRWIRPLRRVGVDPERVALTISMAIQALPGTLTIAQETRDAARARGLGRSPRAYLTPFVIRVVARAHETGDALKARGLGD